ncbi:Hypothetical predicted protein [Paramuricea clavata]|uniref:Uncharacterized protein n=1 Tax=Paramuricea clavata TaxID=317549 RepID=A0A7D9HRH8_PARCT|nr:Hypothetical predicted protein [Paramuricea clavata]
MSKRGRGKINHKGRNRHFITEAEVEAEQEKERKDKEWRQRHGNKEVDDDDDSDKKESEESGDSDEESGSDEEEKVRKPKGVDGLIEINNPNRNQKATKKVTDLDTNTEATLSRREREELEKQQAQQRYQKLHAEGKTEQAQRDLARLAIIRKQREEAARKKEEVKKAQEKGKAK